MSPFDMLNLMLNLPTSYIGGMLRSSFCFISSWTEGRVEAGAAANNTRCMQRLLLHDFWWKVEQETGLPTHRSSLRSAALRKSRSILARIQVIFPQSPKKLLAIQSDSQKTCARRPAQYANGRSAKKKHGNGQVGRRRSEDGSRSVWERDGVQQQW